MIHLLTCGEGNTTASTKRVQTASCPHDIRRDQRSASHLRILNDRDARTRSRRGMDWFCIRQLSVPYLAAGRCCTAKTHWRSYLGAFGQAIRIQMKRIDRSIDIA